jgi:hypothetical protein
VGSPGTVFGVHHFFGNFGVSVRLCFYSGLFQCCFWFLAQNLGLFSKEFLNVVDFLAYKVEVAHSFFSL